MLRTGVVPALFLGLLSFLGSACDADVSGPNRAPVAVAGPDVQMELDDTVTLDGRGSWDPDDDALSYLWTVISSPDGLAATIVNPDSSRAEFTPEQGGLFLIALQVDDGRLWSQRDVVQVRVVFSHCTDDQQCLDEDPCTSDLCLSGRCVNELLGEGAPCDDQDMCTSGDSCVDGTCSGTAVDCAHLDDACNSGLCDPASGQCQAQPKPDGTTCDDDLFCTENDICQGGSCTSSAYDCSHLDRECVVGECDEGSDSCVETILPNESVCDDQDPCTMDDVCSTGLCAGRPLDEDGDGYVAQSCGGNDCDDQTALSNPGQFEGGFGDPLCQDGRDNDCDELTDGEDQTCQACTQDSDCEDGNQCNGQETCSVTVCAPGTPLDCDDQNPCTDDTCLAASGCANSPNLSPCDDELFCTLNDSCQGGSCVGSGSPCTQDCLGLCDEDGGACTPDDQGTPCTEDGVYCNGLESCDGLGNCLSGGDPCPGTECENCQEDSESCFDPPATPCTDDGLYCTGAELCDGAGQCLSSGDPCPNDECTHCDEDRDVCFDPAGVGCTDDGLFCNGLETCNGTGLCAPAGNPCPETECQHCDELSQSCFDPLDSPCLEDGYACSADVCDGAGDCTHPGDHQVCLTGSSGDTCSPACFSSADGCGMRPADPKLSCVPGQLDPAEQIDSTCGLILELTGQANCLHCSAEYGHLIVDFSDFGEDQARLDPNGWRMHQGNVCRDAAGVGCVAGGGDRDCCGDFSTIGVAAMGSFGLVCDEATNCDHREEWRMSKTIDTRGVHDLRVCINLLERAVNANDAVYILADNGSDSDVVLCQRGPMRAGPDDISENVCADLPVWAAEQESLTLTLVAHSEVWNHVWGIDWVEVKGWSTACGPDVVEALVEDFEDCTAFQNDWTVLGSPVCAQDTDCFSDSSRIEVENDSVTLARVVDASDLDADVELCFWFGDENANAGERLSVYFDAGRGWVKVYELLGNAGANNACIESCVNLSRHSPAVNNNPSLAIRFELVSDGSGSRQRLDQVVVRGARNCDAAGVLAVDQPSDVGAGNYDFAVTNSGANPLTAWIDCLWDDPELGVGAQTRIDYRRKPSFAEWTYKRRLTLDNTGRAEQLDDFPVPILLDDSRIDYTVMQDDGRDLMFVASDGVTVLAHDLERFDKTDTSVAWVRVPLIPADSNAEFIWMYYGNSEVATSEWPAGVWDDSFVGVWHMAASNRADGEPDLSYPAHDGTYSGGAAIRQNGPLGDWAVDFDGSDDFLNLGQIDVDSGQDDGLSMELVFFKQAGGADDGRLMSKSNGNQDANHWWMLSLYDPDNNDYRLRFRVKPDGGNTEVLLSNTRPVTQDSWVYAVASYDGMTMRIYADGQEVASQTLADSAPVATDPNVYASLAANYISHYSPFGGLLAEARLSSSARSALWIGAQHQAMQDALANPFVVFGNQEVP